MAHRDDLHWEPAEQETRVTVRHRGWEAPEEAAARIRPGYESGWDHRIRTRFGGGAAEASTARETAST